jgi:hypothetical protein
VASLVATILARLPSPVRFGRCGDGQNAQLSIPPAHYQNSVINTGICSKCRRFRVQRAELGLNISFLIFEKSIYFIRESSRPSGRFDGLGGHRFKKTTDLLGGSSTIYQIVGEDLSAAA